MQIRENFPRAIVEHADQGIIMPDGCRLSARIWMPADAAANPVPVILEHLPYRKRDGTTHRDCLTHPWFAGHGYACIRTDMRGNGDSEGLMDDEYTDQEWADAVAVIEWAAAQPWCNGKAGMMGISWGGFNGLQVAALRPPALKAVITLCSTVDRYADDIHYKGGCLLNENVGWAANMLSYSSRPPDPALAGDKWHGLWLARLEAMPDLAARWLSHPARDAYWKRGSICEDYGSINAAVLSFGGWHDGYRNTMSHLAANLKAPVKAIAGPWIHKYPHYAAPQPAIGFLQEARRWWDRWLKDIETGVEADPAMRLWLMDSVRPAPWHDARPGRWISEAEWPSPHITAKHFTLGADGLDSGSASFNRIVATPQHCGLSGGEYFPFTFGPELPGDQREDDAMSVCFDGGPLGEALDIVGAPTVTLSAASDRPQANLCVRLCDVHPDGASELISYGVLNLCQRTSREFPEALTPGENYSAVITLDQCAYRLPSGHRLRVAVSTSWWPAIWPSPEPAAVTLCSGSLSLPLRPLAKGDEWRFEEPEAAALWRTDTLRPALSTRETTTGADGTISLTVFNDFGDLRDLDHGLENGSLVREVFSIHPDDPLSACASFHWEQTGGRDAWQWRTVADCELTASQTMFHLSQKLQAWENGRQVFNRQWKEDIERKFV